MYLQRVIRHLWVYFFIRTDLGKYIITLLDHHCIICSEWVPSEWESKQEIKHCNYPQVIHTTQVHQLMFCELKSSMFVVHKFIKYFKTSNHCFWIKYESSIHNIALSSEVVLFTSTKRVKNHSNQICWWILMWEDIGGWTFSLEEAFLCIKNSYLSQKWRFKVKMH